VPPPPYVLLSCATSADGYLDDASPERLILSGPADLDRVDEVRAGCDAILVGAQTIRADNPRLLVRDPRRSARRAARGLPAHPARVTITATGDLDPGARFFAPGALRLVYCATSALPLATKIKDSAVLIDAGDPVSADFMLQDLAERGVARLLVEGGARVLGDFLAADRADELDLAVAPFFVADPAPPASASPLPARRPDDPGRDPPGRRGRAAALPARPRRPGPPVPALGGGALPAVPPSDSAFSVGRSSSARTARSWPPGSPASRRTTTTPRRWRLRKLTQRKLGPDPRLRHATLYSSLVPCGARASRPVTCVGHIVAAGIPRVVFAWREPRLFTDGEGAEQLRAAGVAVTEVPELAERARAVNAHLVGTGA
jgi:5-amino-6-(5-phosphoribosylamino)uracil reductase